MWTDDSFSLAMAKVDAIFPVETLIDLSERYPCGSIASKKVRAAESALVARQYEPHQFPKLAGVAYRALLLVCALNEPAVFGRLEELGIDPDDPLYGVARSSALGGLLFDDARDIYLGWASDERIMRSVDADREIRDQGDFVLFAGIAFIHMAHHKQSENIREAFDLLAIGIEVLAANDEFLYLAAADALEQEIKTDEAKGKQRARLEKDASSRGFDSYEEMKAQVAREFLETAASFPNANTKALRLQLAEKYKYKKSTIDAWIREYAPKDL